VTDDTTRGDAIQRDVPRELRLHATPIEVISADEAAGTIRIVVVGWSIDSQITVPLTQFTADTGLSASELTGARWLEADVNIYAPSAEALRFQDITVAPDLPAGFMGTRADTDDTTHTDEAADAVYEAADRIVSYLEARAQTAQFEEVRLPDGIARLVGPHAQQLNASDLRTVLAALDNAQTRADHLAKERKGWRSIAGTDEIEAERDQLAARVAELAEERHSLYGRNGVLGAELTVYKRRVTEAEKRIAELEAERDNRLRPIRGWTNSRLEILRAKSYPSLATEAKLSILDDLSRCLDVLERDTDPDNADTKEKP